MSNTNTGKLCESLKRQGNLARRAIVNKFWRPFVTTILHPSLIKFSKPKTKAMAKSNIHEEQSEDSSEIMSRSLQNLALTTSNAQSLLASNPSAQPLAPPTIRLNGQEIQMTHMGEITAVWTGTEFIPVAPQRREKSVMDTYNQKIRCVTRTRKIGRDEYEREGQRKVLRRKEEAEEAAEEAARKEAAREETAREETAGLKED